MPKTLTQLVTDTDIMIRLQAEGHPETSSSKLGLELIIIRVASASELKPGPEKTLFDKEIAGYNETFSRGVTTLATFISAIADVSDDEWTKDGWSWALNPGSIPYNQYPIKGTDKNEIIDIASKEMQSRVVTIKAGNEAEVLKEVEFAATNGGKYAKIVVSMHGGGSECSFPDGFSSGVGNFKAKLIAMAKGKPLMFIACGQVPTGDVRGGAGFTQKLYYRESLFIEPDVNQVVKDSPDCSAKLGLYGAKKGLTHPDKQGKMPEKWRFFDLK